MSPKSRGSIKKSKPKIKKINFKNFFYSKTFIVIGTLLLIFILFSLAKEIIRKNEINNEIAQLQAEITALESQNTEMDDMLKYLNSSNFLEKEAKERLSLQEQGEKIVMLPNSGENQKVFQDDKSGIQTRDSSNPQKWKKYFLNN